MISGHHTVFPVPRQVALEPHEYNSPGPGEVLIRTERTLISTGTELHVLSGGTMTGPGGIPRSAFPTTIGYSSAGTILEVGSGVVGSGVEGYRPGDRVASVGPHASHALVEARHVWPIPEEVAMESAAFSSLGEIALGGLRRGRLAFGESVAIIGAGLLGQLAAQGCRAAGASPIIVIDTAAIRLEKALALGATHTLAMPATEARAEIERLTHGRMADVVIEVTGNPHAIPAAFKLARLLGRVVRLGSPRGSCDTDFYTEAHSLGLEIIGAHNRTHPPVETPQNPWTIRRHVELFLEWQRTGRIDVRPLITHRYPWRQTPEAFAMLVEDRTRALGVILDWTTE